MRRRPQVWSIAGHPVEGSPRSCQFLGDRRVRGLVVPWIFRRVSSPSRPLDGEAMRASREVPLPLARWGGASTRRGPACDRPRTSHTQRSPWIGRSEPVHAEAFRRVDRDITVCSSVHLHDDHLAIRRPHRAGTDAFRVAWSLNATSRDCSPKPTDKRMRGRGRLASRSTSSQPSTWATTTSPGRHRVCGRYWSPRWN